LKRKSRLVKTGHTNLLWSLMIGLEMKRDERWDKKARDVSKGLWRLSSVSYVQILDYQPLLVQAKGGKVF